MPTRNFVHSPPLKGSRPRRSKRKLPLEPRGMKNKWQQSVYYYWWAFLREHRGYIETCANGGGGEYQLLYEDFGDIREDDFWSWWRTHQNLFAEPELEDVSLVAVDDLALDDKKYLFLKIPLEGKLPFRLRQVRRILETKLPNDKYRRRLSKAKYTVSGKPVIKALDAYLKTYQLRTASPKLPFASIYEMIEGWNVSIDEAMSPRKKNRKYGANTGMTHIATRTQTAYRNYKKAVEIIENVGKGMFPLMKVTNHKP
jgi:hypothetical protein